MGFSLDLPLNPSFTFYNDYDEARYQYYTLGFREPIPLPFGQDQLELTPYVVFAFAENADDGPIFYIDDGLVHIDLGASLDIQLDNFFVSPNFNYSFENDDGLVNEFWFGVDFGINI